ncbi:conserved unknown protein [Ectocarpus siliculosus]|uniref:Amino acid transporter transmembrane domain-containing protein n=1 Tax=Ectocarpus siliculosus TaxID=2880 RepID=D8LFS4_ECTSI|nr:conserved unknown protein [Ectocarpus siliculosus]|eukprot:CBN75648.1 conserved unknown protein [Ectocarpus siliculosus]
MEMTAVVAGENGQGLEGGGTGSSENTAAAAAAAAERAERYPAGNSSAAGAVSNFVNTIVGAGIIGLPFALAESGLWAGVFLLCLAAFLTNRSTNMLIAAGEKIGRLNYEELMADSFGNAGVYLYSFFVVLLGYGAMSAYLIIVADTIPAIAEASGTTNGPFADRHAVIFMFGIFVVLPLSLLKDLSKLAYTSGISVLADVFLTLIVFFAGAGEASTNDDIDSSERFVFIRPTVFAGFGAISFAFVSQSASFLVYRSMSKGGVDRWACVTRWSVSIALGLGLTLALSGYLNFVNETDANILNNLGTRHGPANIARAFLALTMVFTYPMEMYVARHALDVAVFQTWLGKGPTTQARHFGISIALWVLSIVLAASTKNLGSILEIFGAFSANAVGYVMPALLFIKSNREEFSRASAVWKKGTPEYHPALGERLWAMQNFFVPMFMVFFGILAMVAGVATAVASELSPTKA